MKKIFLSILILNIFPYSATAWQSRIFPYEGEGAEAVEYFENLSVEEVFQNFQRNDQIGFISVYGFNLMTPGLTEAQREPCLFSKLSSYVIQGTSDSPTGDVEAKFNRVTYSFAESFNTKVLSYIEEKGICKE